MTNSTAAPAGGLRAWLAPVCIWAERLAIAMLFIMTALIVAQVLGRNLMNLGLPWAEELARYAGLTLVYMAAPLLLLNNKHIVVDIISSRVKGMAGHVLQLINECLTLAFCLLFMWGGWAFIQRAGKFSTAALGMPNTLYYLPALLGMGLLTLVSFARLLERLSAGSSKGAAP